MSRDRLPAPTPNPPDVVKILPARAGTPRFAGTGCSTLLHPDTRPESRLQRFSIPTILVTPTTAKNGETRTYPSNAARPVMSCPITRVWMSWVPSYVFTVSRFAM